MWQYYYSDVKVSNPDLHPVSKQTFVETCRHENIGLRKFDLFDNPIRVELNSLKVQLSTCIESERAALEEKIALIQKDLDFAEDRKILLRNKVKALEGQNDRAVMVFDFSGFQTSISNRFHVLVIVLLTNKPIDTSKIEDLAVVVEEPLSMNPKQILETPEIQVKKRRTKKELAEQNYKRPQVHSHKHNLEAAKKKKYLDPNNVSASSQYKPIYTHFHFILKRGENDNDGQSSQYVQYCMEEYLLKHKCLSGFSNISLFSDGCKTHNKNYHTQFFLAEMKSKLQIADFMHHVLAPYEAHNQCDSSIAHAKIALNKDIAQGSLMKEIANIAYSYERCNNNYFLFEVQSKNFPSVKEIINLNPFVAES